MARKAIYKHATEVDANTYPDDGSSPVGTTEWNESPDAEGMFGNTPQTTTVSIATGDLTVTDSITVAAAETGTTDTLDKLLITNTNEYDLIYLFAKTGQTITLTNTSSPSVSGQVKTISGSNEVLSTTKPTILIRNGNYWYGYGGGVVNEINDIGDVVITSVANEDVLAYDTTTSKWINQSADETGRVTADSTTTFTNKTISQAQITSLTSDLALKSPLASPTFTGTVVLPNVPAVVTTQLNLKSNKASPTFTGTATAADLTVTGTLTGNVTGNTSGSSGSTTGNAATVTTNANLTGDVTSVGNATTTVTNANLTGIVTSAGNATAVANGAIAIAKLATDPLSYANMTAPSASVAFNTQKLTGVLAGVASTDVATKGQLDTAVASNITLKGAYDAANDNPHLDSGTRVAIAIGDHYVVTVAGTFYSEVLQAGDSLISTVASPTAFAQWIITNNNVVTPITNAQVAAGAAIDQSKIASLTTDLGLKAPKATPIFSGDVTTPSSVLKNQGIAGLSGVTITTPVSNSTGHVVVTPSGSGTRGQITTSNSSDPTTNGELLAIGSDIYSANEHAIRTQATGSGTVRPLAIYFDTTKVCQISDATGIDMNGHNLDNVQNIIHDISSGSLTIDFSTDQLQTLTITNNSTFATPSNMAAGKSKTYKLNNSSGSSTYTFTFPAWKFIGVKPTDIAPTKTGILTLTCFGTSNTDCVAAYAVEA